MFVEAEEWGAAEHVIVASAPQLINQGRWQTMGQWVEALPPGRVWKRIRGCNTGSGAHGASSIRLRIAQAT